MELYISNGKLGNGLYTKHIIEPNNIILSLEGNLVVSKENVSILSEDLLQISKDTYLDMSNRNEFFINHSCNPNVGIKTLGLKAVLVSIRKINSNEELLMDYSSTSNEDLNQWKMNCRCESWNCRKIVSGFQHLSKIEQDYLINKNIVPDYIVESIKNI